MIQLQNYIDGELVAPNSKLYINNFQPSTGKIFAKIPDSDAEDVETAVIAAKRAFPKWANTPKAERSAIVLRIADLILSKLGELAQAESQDNGKPVSLAIEVDIPRAAANFHFYGTAILHTSTESYINEDRQIDYTLRQPLGIVGCISPWNLPLYLLTWKITPALASGNCVIAKPSEITPLTAYMLSSICQKAGLPKGVLNIVHGFGQKVGEAIVKHPDIKAISFTGGTATGARISTIAAPHVQKNVIRTWRKESQYNIC